MEEHQDFAAWYDSAEREQLADELTVTHVKTIDGTVTLARDRLTVDAAHAKWEPVIEVLYDAAENQFEFPLEIPVDTAVESLGDSGLVRREGTDSARRRGRALLALLYAEGAIDFDDETVSIPTALGSDMGDIKEVYMKITFAKCLDILCADLSERLDIYHSRMDEIDSRIAEIEQTMAGDLNPEFIDETEKIEQSFGIYSRDPQSLIEPLNKTQEYIDKYSGKPSTKEIMEQNKQKRLTSVKNADFNMKELDKNIEAPDRESIETLDRENNIPENICKLFNTEENILFLIVMENEQQMLENEAISIRKQAISSSISFVDPVEEVDLESVVTTIESGMNDDEWEQIAETKIESPEDILEKYRGKNKIEDELSLQSKPSDSEETED